MRRFCAYHGSRISPWLAAQIGGSARGYQAIFVPLAALSSPGYGPNGRSASRIFQPVAQTAWGPYSALYLERLPKSSPRSSVTGALARVCATG
jgi:hypothetical protein